MSAQKLAAPKEVISHLSYQQLDTLHVLRGFCAFYVVIYHAKFILWSGGQQYLEAIPRSGWQLIDYFAFSVDMLSAAGYEMVIFFFVLSGFFIRYAFIRKPRTPWSFYFNRIVRIYPPFIISLLLAGTILYILSNYFLNTIQAGSSRELNQNLNSAWMSMQVLDFWELLKSIVFLPLNIEYLGNNVVYWSLLPEALFYLLVPFVFRMAPSYYALSVLSYIISVIMIRMGITTIWVWMLQYNLFFALGAALYDTIVKTKILERVRKLPGLLLWALVLGLLLLLIGMALVKLKLLAAFMAGILAVVAVLVLLAGKIAQNNFVFRAFHKLGVFSFSLYLYHYPLLLLCYGLMVAITGKLFWYERYYLLIVPLVTVICYGLYWITERVFVNYFRKM